MNTTGITFRWQTLAVLLAVTLLVPGAFSDRSERQERSDRSRQQRSSQPAEPRAESSSQQRTAARTQARAASRPERPSMAQPAPAPARTQAQPQRRSAPVRQAAAQRPQPQQAAPAPAPQRPSPAAAPAQTPRSTRSAPSTRQAPSTRSAPSTRQAPSTRSLADQPPRDTTPARTAPRRSFTRVNRTVEVADRKPTQPSPESATRRAVVTRRSASASNEKTAANRSTRVSAVITPSASKTAAQPARTEKPAAVQTPSQRVTSQISSSRSRGNEATSRSRTIEPAAQTPTTTRIDTSTAAKPAVTTKPTGPDKTAAAEKTVRRPTRSTTGQSSTSFDVYGAASRRGTPSKAIDSKTDTSNSDKAAETRTRSEAAGKRSASRDRSKTVMPNRVTVEDIKTNRVAAPARSRQDVSPGDLKQKRSVRIHSENERSRRPGHSTASKSTDLSIRNNTMVKSHGSRDQGRHSRSHRSEPATKIVINNDNRVIVQGKPSRDHHRPHFSRRLVRDIHYIRTDPLWVNYGSGFYFRWSSSSCGTVVSLPYHYTTVHYDRPHYGLSYCYPRYHRKYVFVSVGGYWPYSYRYRRYYWYGCHPYYWYGSRVIYEPQQNVTYNTYNYYSTESTTGSDAGYGFSSSRQPYYTLGEPKGDVIDEPEFQSPADLCFDNAVALFEAGKYDQAVDQFREAVNLSPDDVILPFTYSQALFAEGEFAHAASVLRAAMANIPDEELTIYYPRGLYESDDVLTAQIEALKQAADGEPFASDYQLLLGYQYLGLGELDKALIPLAKAATDPANEQAAGKLIDLAAQLQAEAEAKESQS